MMTVSRQHIGDIAERVLGFFEEKRILSARDLDRYLGSRFSYSSGDYVLIERKPPECCTPSRVVTYVCESEGTPLEARVNETNHRSLLIVQGDFTLPGYTPFGTDYHGNALQYKEWRSSDFSYMKREIRLLIDKITIPDFL